MQDMNEAIHVTRWGTAGPRVVLVHGSAQGTSTGGDHCFAAQATLAEQGWQLILPDRPGHGRSPAPGRPDDAEADGARVAELLGDGAHLVGHSFGGCVALAAAARRPGAVRSLTMIEPAMAPLAIDEPEVREYVGALGAMFAAATSPFDVAVGFSRLVGIPDAMRDARDREELARLGAGIVRMKLPDAQTLRPGLGAVNDAGIPLLVVTGGWNPAFERIAAAAARLGGGEHVVVPAPHHFPHRSGAFNDRLAAFMSAAEGRAAPWA